MSAKVTAHKREGVRRTTVANSLPMLCVCPALECLVNWDADVVKLPQSTYRIACELLITHILPEVPLWDSMYSIHSVNMQALISKISDRGDCGLGLSCLVEGYGFAIQMVSVKVGIRLRRNLPWCSFFRICFCLRWLFVSFTVTHNQKDHHGHQQTIDQMALPGVDLTSISLRPEAQTAKGQNDMLQVFDRGIFLDGITTERSLVFVSIFLINLTCASSNLKKSCWLLMFIQKRVISMCIL